MPDDDTFKKSIMDAYQDAITAGFLVSPWQSRMLANLANQPPPTCIPIEGAAGEIKLTGVEPTGLVIGDIRVGSDEIATLREITTIDDTALDLPDSTRALLNRATEQWAQRAEESALGIIQGAPDNWEETSISIESLEEQIHNLAASGFPDNQRACEALADEAARYIVQDTGLEVAMVRDYLAERLEVTAPQNRRHFAIETCRLIDQRKFDLMMVPRGDRTQITHIHVITAANTVRRRIDLPMPAREGEWEEPLPTYSQMQANSCNQTPHCPMGNGHDGNCVMSTAEVESLLTFTDGEFGTNSEGRYDEDDEDAAAWRREWRSEG